jgi:predicted RecA/RadA family phage recombinase
MKNYIQGDGTVAVPAPYDCLSGDFIVVGALYGVVVNDTLSGVLAEIKREGVYELPKATGAWTKGDQLYWDNSAKNFTKTAAGNRPVGIAFDDAVSGDTTGNVSIDEVPSGLVNAVAGVGAGYKIARGSAAALDGGNPTPIATGLATIVAAIVSAARHRGAGR